MELMGPIQSMKRPMSSTSQRLGAAVYSGSMVSMGMVVWDKSYNRFCSSSCSGCMGRNGRKMLAPTTLNTFPKFELTAILMYLMMLPKVKRPWCTPRSRTMRSFSRSRTSADSFAMSVAVSTEIPTSACFRAGASLTPSPRNPTVCPCLCKAVTIRDLWNGASLAKTVVSATMLANSSSVMASMSGPTTMLLTGRPMSLHTFWVMMLLSPVSTFTSTPLSRSAAIASIVSSFGGSRKQR
mmetsp:Transcript_49179/g.87797  ORF Transcript_49179/g.87797 Transcript_49179/m.87797 type:complete len:239 (-) Transcript_49179:313-1029(-)